MAEQLYGVGTRVEHPQFGLGVITKILFGSYEITFVKRGQIEIAHHFQDMEIIEEVWPDKNTVEMAVVSKTLEGILRKWSDFLPVIPMGDRWEGGTMILKPANPQHKSKEIPIETFFHKIVMVRDRLRVMEQRINSSKLSDEEKVNLQQYISRIYGSLTTFNILFEDKEHHFNSKLENPA